MFPSSSPTIPWRWGGLPRCWVPPPLSFWGGMREVSRTKGITQILFEFSPIEKAPSLIDLRRPLSVIAVVCSFTGDPPKLAPTPFLCVGPSIRWVPIPVKLPPF